MGVSGSPISVRAGTLGLYPVFTRLLPGIVFVVGVAPLLPSGWFPQVVTLPAVLVGGVLGFATGQFLYSTASLLEGEGGPDGVRERLGVRTHRDRFEAEYEFDPADGRVETAFCREFAREFGFHPSEVETGTVYTLVRSQIEMDRRSRSPQLQAFSSFCRSMAVALPLVGVAVTAGWLLSGTHGYQPFVGTLSAEFVALLDATLLVATVVFLYGHGFYDELYVEYLPIDFLNLRS